MQIVYDEMNNNVERYRICGTVQRNEEHPYFEFRSEVFFAFIPEDIEMIKQAANDFQVLFGLKDWEVQVEKTRDKWERVTL